MALKKRLWIDPKIENNKVTHFRKGRINEWREVFSPKQIEIANKMIPEKIFKALNLEK